MELLEMVKKAGVVGAGGAGFPTHVKLDCRVQTFIANGAECEPLLQTDKYLMKKNSKEIIKGIEVIGKHIGATNKILAVKRKNIKEIESLQNAIDTLNADVELFLLDNFFPTGDEHVLTYEVTGRDIPAGGIPLQVDTVVSNVATIADVYKAMEGKPVIRKILSVLGEVNNPTLLEVPLGVSIKRCIDEAGGAKIKDYCTIIGGPMMGEVLDQELLEERVITKTDGAIIVVPKNHYIVNRNRLSIKHIINQAKSACIQCCFCTDLCPRFLIGHSLRPHKIMRTIGTNPEKEEILQEALICCECGICELYACPMGLSPRLVNGYLKREFAKKGIKYERTNNNLEPNSMRDYRKIPVNRLISRLDLNAFKNQQLNELKEIDAKKVSVPLKQHIGRMATPLVAIGDMVKRGDLIGFVKKGELGANIHASIGGRVIEVTEKIVIEVINSGVIEC